MNRDFTATSIRNGAQTLRTFIPKKMAGRIKLLVEDLYSRKIIGWAFGKIMDAQLAVMALRNAALNVKHTEGIIIQSDMGS